MDSESFIELLKDWDESCTLQHGKLSQDISKIGLELCQSVPGFIERLAKLLTVAQCPFGELSHLAFRLGALNPDTAILLSKIWSHYIASLLEPQRLGHLDRLLKSDQVTFFKIVRLLPHTPALLDLDELFSTDWLPQLLQKASGDMAIGPLYDFFELWFDNDHKRTISAIKKWNTIADDETIELAAHALGTLRNIAPTKVNKLSKEYQLSKRRADRTIYFRSWRTTSISSLPNSDIVRNLLYDINTSLPNERTEGLRLVGILFSRPIDSEILSHASKWLLSLDGSTLETAERFFIADSLARGWDNQSPAFASGVLLPLSGLLVEIQPVAEDHKGTWGRITEVALAIHRSAKDQFHNLCRALFERNPSALQNLFSARQSVVGDEATDILSTLTGQISDYVFSPDRLSRQYGFQLIKLCHGYELSEEKLFAKSEEALALAIFETRVCYMEGASKMRFLLSLLTRIKNASDDLQTAYSDELFYQGCNLPGENTALLKAAAANSPLAAAVLQRVNSYFDALREANQSPIEKMAVPGYILAQRFVIRRQARQINDAMKNGSSLLQFFKSSTIIYGSEGFQSYFNGSLAQPTSFNKSSTSMEFPRLDISNSDGQRIEHAIITKHQDQLAASILRKEQESE